MSGARLREDVRQHLGPLLPRGRHPLQETSAGDLRRRVQASQGQLYRVRQPAELEAVLLHPHGQQAQGHSAADGRRNVGKISVDWKIKDITWLVGNELSFFYTEIIESLVKT